jgi:hypothetical protein
VSPRPLVAQDPHHERIVELALEPRMRPASALLHEPDLAVGADRALVVREDLEPDPAHAQVTEGEVEEGPDGVLAEALPPVLAAERDPQIARPAEVVDEVELALADQLAVELDPEAHHAPIGFLEPLVEALLQLGERGRPGRRIRRASEQLGIVVEELVQTRQILAFDRAEADVLTVERGGLLRRPCVDRVAAVARV